MNNLFIKPKYLQMLLNIFKAYCPEATIWAYGSRLGGDSHDGSDLDLAVIDFGDAKCSLGELKSLLSDSDIPFLVDVVEYSNLSDIFQKEILKNYIEIYPRQ